MSKRLVELTDMALSDVGYLGKTILGDTHFGVLIDQRSRLQAITHGPSTGRE